MFKKCLDNCKIAGHPYATLILALLLLFACVCIDAAVLMLAWNIVLPALFASVPALSFWQAFWLWVVCDCLFNHKVSNN